MDAFGHLKGIGANKTAVPLLKKAGVKRDEGVTGLGKDFIEAARQRFWGREPQVRTWRNRIIGFVAGSKMGNACCSAADPVVLKQVTAASD
jgi:hypothetical protein